MHRCFCLPALLIALTVVSGAQHDVPGPAQGAQGHNLRYSYARPWLGCSPVDEAESGITLTKVKTTCSKKIEESTRPYISVMYEVGGKPGPLKVVYETSTQTAWATRCLPGREKCDAATSGTIDLTGHDTKNHLPSYELHFSDGSIEQGTFTLDANCHPHVQCW